MISLNLLDQSQATDAKRPCEGCTACCTALAVQEIGKPYYERCDHLKTRCGIYKDRPLSCRDFECVWRMGLYGTNDKKYRPDNCDFILNIDNDQHGNWLEVFELEEGALNGHEVVIDSVSARIGGLQGIRVYPPGSKIAMLADTAAQYKGTGLKVRNFLTCDGIHFIYDEEGSAVESITDNDLLGTNGGGGGFAGPSTQDQLRTGGPTN